MPRPRDDPTSEDVLDAMEVGGCDMVADVVDALAATDAAGEKEDEDEAGDGDGGPNRWTVRYRLEELVEDGLVERIDHVNDNVTYHRLE